jgi:phosphotriesterase-related protein
MPKASCAPSTRRLEKPGARRAALTLLDLTGKILTVRGPVEPDQLGVTLTHEHIFIDLRRTHLPHRTWKIDADRVVADSPDEDFPATELARWEAKLDLSNMHQARAVAPIADNYVLSDERLAIEELLAFKAAGGGTVVDVTSIGLKRDPRALERVSESTGLHIIMGTGYYQRVYHPDDMDRRSIDDLSRTIVRDVTVGVHDGIDQTDIRAGVIGEIGINGDPLISNELKSMRAAAIASRLTGATILIHLGGVGAEKHKVLDIAAEEGVHLSHVILGHCDGIAADISFLLELLQRGVYIAFDNLAREPAVAAPSSTAVAAQAVPRLIEAGFEDRILLSQDICWKTSLKAYGGFGYTFIQDQFLPRLRELGVGQAQIDKLMVSNPRQAFAFVAPGSR